MFQTLWSEHKKERVEPLIHILFNHGYTSAGGICMFKGVRRKAAHIMNSAGSLRRNWYSSLALVSAAGSLFSACSDWVPVPSSDQSYGVGGRTPSLLDLDSGGEMSWVATGSTNWFAGCVCGKSRGVGGGVDSFPQTIFWLGSTSLLGVWRPRGIPFSSFCW